MGFDDVPTDASVFPALDEEDEYVIPGPLCVLDPLIDSGIGIKGGMMEDGITTSRWRKEQVPVVHDPVGGTEAATLFSSNTAWSFNDFTGRVSCVTTLGRAIVVADAAIVR